MNANDDRPDDDRPGDESDSPSDESDRIPHSFRSDFARTTATNVLIALSGAVTGIILARTLVPRQRGELAAIQNWPTLLGMLAAFGLTEALVYFTARRGEQSGRYLGTSLLLGLAGSALFAAVGWFLTPVVLAAQRPEIVTATRWYLLQIPVAVVLGLANRPLRGRGDVVAWNVVRFGPTLVWTLVVVGTALAGRADPVLVAELFVAGRATLVVPTLWFVRHRLRQRLRPDPALAAPLLRFGVPSMLAVLPNTLNLRLDQLVMPALLRSASLGQYAVAVAWSMLPQPVLLAFGSVLFPRVAGRRVREDQHRLVAQGLRIGVLLSGSLAAVTVALTPVGLPLLFGDIYRNAVPTAMVLGVATAVIGVNLVQEEAVRGLGRPAFVLWSELAGMAVTLTGLFVLLPRYQIGGAAVASLLGYSTSGLAFAWLLRRTTGLGWTVLFLPRSGDVRAMWEQAPWRRRPADA